MTDEEMKSPEEPGENEFDEYISGGGPAPTIYGKSAFVTSIAGGTGGTVYSPATGITTTTGSTGSTSSSFGAWVSPTAPPKKIVGMPGKITKKVLVAFLDDDDDPVWAKKLVPVTMNIYWEDSEDAPRMTLDLSLEDKHGNEK